MSMSMVDGIQLYDLIKIQAIIIYTTGEQMLRLMQMSGRWFGSSAQRRQNFFQLNPIYPDAGQKDFDMYNVDYNHVLTGTLTISDETRYNQLKAKLTKEVYLGPVLEKTYGHKKGEVEIDEETGFPIGLHENFDNFIEIFKRDKKVGSNVVGQFQNLVMTLMNKFNAKSELELIKIFRLNIANTRKNSFKDKLRALAINTAFIRFLQERKADGLRNDSLRLDEIAPFLSSETKQTSKDAHSNHTTKRQLEQVIMRQTLKEIDDKIAKLEEQIQAKAVADGTYVPTYHPRYGEAITQEVQVNLNYDLNFPRGNATLHITNQPVYTASQVQDRQIQSRINKLFFAEVLKRIQSKKQIEPQEMIDIQNLPLNIRTNDKIINSLLYKYKQYDLLVEPDMKDIYSQIDITMKKIAVKVVPNFIENQTENKKGTASGNSEYKERIITKDALLWKQLDVEEVFDPEHYLQDEVNKVKIEQKQLAELSPSAVLQLSLNKMPFNLYRHADLDNFGVFTKYRKKIYKDYLSDKMIDPEIEFKFFSLEQAQKGLQKIKKPEELPDRFYGHAKRKSSEAQVFVTPGTGKVIINNEPLADYCGDVYHRGEALKPLIFTETAGKYDVEFTVVGGGIHSQSECMAMALTKALIMVNPKYERILAQFGLVGTDDRKKEPKRIGLYSARVRPPYVRR